jgi:hypothetical protein
MSRRWLYWPDKISLEVALPILLFLALLLVGGLLGLSDDEAYHWVLAQRPALGYAFHPPGMGLMVALSQFFLSPLIGKQSVIVVRMPAAITMGIVLFLAMRWMRLASGVRDERAVLAGALGAISFTGLFGLGWMLVPDTPLFLGWMLAFYFCWVACTEREPGKFWGPGLAAGVAIAILGKFSGVLVPTSAVIAGFFLARPGWRRFTEIFAWAALGTILAAIPIVAWNLKHEWGSILFQIRDRHSKHEWSLLRYSRFWLVSLIAAGPVILLDFFKLLGRQQSPVNRFIQIWVLPPALIYCFQPLWSDFKPHWAFIIWWPVALGFGLRLMQSKKGTPLAARFQIAYGLGLALIVISSCFKPWGMEIMEKAMGAPQDPRLDVTNDFYGWDGLAAFLKDKGVPAGTPVIGSRYQTAAHAAFALGTADEVSLVPRDLKARDEWAMLDAVESFGPAWPRLRSPVVYVADIRYTAPPEFPDARCDKLGRIETRRGPYLAKWVDAWKCEPQPARP